MIRGPVQASVPTLERFPREVSYRAHLHPAEARSASPLVLHPSADWRLHPSIASATFWRSPYNEIFRQPRFVGPGRQEQPVASAKQSPTSSERGDATVAERAIDPVKSILKNGVDSRDSASDTSSDNARKIRGILCKSSVSCSSRQSTGKVQKRVKFDVNLDYRQPRFENFPACISSKTDDRSDMQQPARPVSMTADDGKGRSLLRTYGLRHDGHRLQTVDKASPHLPNHLQPHNQQELVADLDAAQGSHRSARTVSRYPGVPFMTLPRSLMSRDRQKDQRSAFELMQTPHPSPSEGTRSAVVSSRVNPHALEFKIYRRPLSICSGSSLQNSSAPRGRGRFFDNRVGSSSSSTPITINNNITSGSRVTARLSRSMTSPEITLPRQVRRLQPSVQDELSFMLSTTRLQPHLGNSSAAAARLARPKAAKVRDERGDDDEEEQDDDEQQCFLDDDKTVHILHWLEEVGHTQTREGRCPIFPNSISREA